MKELYLHSPIQLHAVQRNNLNFILVFILVMRPRLIRPTPFFLSRSATFLAYQNMCFALLCVYIYILPIPVAARLLGLWFRIPPEAWMSVSCECCVLSVEVSATSWSLVQRSPTECGVSKKCVIVKPRTIRQPRPPRGSRVIEKIYIYVYITQIIQHAQTKHFTLWNR
jgi:hypothetical protein